MSRNGNGKHLWCDECNLPIADIVSDVLVFETHHYGKKHVTTKTAGQIMKEVQKPLDIPSKGSTIEGRQT